MVIGALCVIDWRWTVTHLARGTYEASPLLAWPYEPGDPGAFSMVKLGATAFGLLVLAWQRHHPMTRVLAATQLPVTSARHP